MHGVRHPLNARRPYSWGRHELSHAPDAVLRAHRRRADGGRRDRRLPPHRGQGLGYAMLTELLQRAGTMGYTRAILWTNRFKLARAVAFYRQIGFFEVPHAGADEDEIWMEMAFAPLRS